MVYQQKISLLFLGFLAFNSTALRAAEIVQTGDNWDLPFLNLRPAGEPSLDHGATSEIEQSLRDNEWSQKFNDADGFSSLIFNRITAEVGQYLDFQLPGFTQEQLGALQAGAAAGLIHLAGPTAGDLTTVLEGDDESDAQTYRMAGQYVACSRQQGSSDAAYASASCDISIVDTSPLRISKPAFCQVFIDQATHLVGGPSWGDGENITVAVRVSQELQGHTVGVYFREHGVLQSSRLTAILGQSGVYRLAFDTVRNPHGDTDVANTTSGVFVLKLDDGRELIAGAAHGDFIFDSALAKTISSTNTGSVSDQELLAAQKTAKSGGTAGVYLNPNRCH